METVNRVITSLVYFNSLVRDTLEYTIPREEYNLNFYNYKKNGVNNETKINSPLKAFIDQNGEKGQKLLKDIEEFADEFYSDHSTVIKLVDGKIEVDHAQNIEIFDRVIPLHENLKNVILFHVEYAKKNNLALDSKIEKLIDADEKYYRAVVYVTLIEEIKRQFDEYNQVRRDAKGEKTPQSNFIEEDLNKLVRACYFIKQQSTLNTKNYADCLDFLQKYIDVISGKNPPEEGKKIEDYFTDARMAFTFLIEEGEKEWRAAYEPCMNELAADLRKENPQAATKEA